MTERVWSRIRAQFNRPGVPVAVLLLATVALDATVACALNLAAAVAYFVALRRYLAGQVEAPAVVRQALTLYESGPADFSDYLLAERARAAGFAPVLTLDKKAAKTATHQLLR